jgi:hypothetical protein
VYEPVKLAFGGPYLGQVDVEEAGRIHIELPSLGLVAFDILTRPEKLRKTCSTFALTCDFVVLFFFATSSP